ncbi:MULTISPECIES: diguanylate cyclase [unclassified Fusibacter]|uniref:GGDEF domain-containing protein n=1 Tax=unclassified Fusibacter TaxID=2624464 RepID=UPI00101158FE|nr:MULTISPECIES: GGDEF domain-containing protein [unclassified Fusibacter]MCK8058875.1 GGDEF domain-containing protein [Fusibacter sp. A2]NPE21950.1 GGDEF domain-containing protein [Fusibacter sp. A1]RXV61518.1 GGDEF domain-containing protein [Fusibacter sp. A1]
MTTQFNLIAFAFVEALILAGLMWIVQPTLSFKRYKLRLTAVPIIALYLIAAPLAGLTKFLGLYLLLILIMRVINKNRLLEACLYSVVIVTIKVFVSFLTAFRQLLLAKEFIASDLLSFFTRASDLGIMLSYLVLFIIIYRFFVNGLRAQITTFKVGHLLVFGVDLLVVLVTFSALNMLYRFFANSLFQLTNIDKLTILLLVTVNALVALVLLLMYLMNSFWLTHFKFKAYRSVAEMDELTGVMNRQSGMSRLSELYKFYKNTDKNFVLCFIDVNNLKVVNDRFGHNEGDRMIRSIATCVSDALRDDDFIARLGGDEFLVCFDMCQLRDAQKAWSRISQSLDKMNLSSDFKYRVSVSQGFASLNDNRKLTLKELIEKADVEMYENKRKYKTKLI